MKRRIRLTESDLDKIIKESVNKVLFSKKYSNSFRRRSLRESFEDEEDEDDALWRQFGYDTNIIHQLSSVSSFKTTDGEEYECTLWIDEEDGPIVIVNDYRMTGEEAEAWLGELEMNMKHFSDPETAWSATARDMAM